MSNDFKTFVIGKYVVADDETHSSQYHYSALKIVDAFTDGRFVVEIAGGLKIFTTDDLQRSIFYTSQDVAAAVAEDENGEDAEQAAA